MGGKDMNPLAQSAQHIQRFLPDETQDEAAGIRRVFRVRFDHLARQNNVLDVTQRDASGIAAPLGMARDVILSVPQLLLNVRKHLREVYHSWIRAVKRSALQGWGIATFVLIAGLLLAAPAWAAVTYDTVSSASTSTSGASSLTWSHTVTSAGSNRLLVVGVASDDNTPRTVSSVTYNGVNLTQVPGGTADNLARVDMWYLVNPATGANDVVVTLSGSTEFSAGATSWTGVDQTTPLGTASATAGHSSSVSLSGVSSAADEFVVDVVAIDSSSATITSDVSQASRWERGGGEATAGGLNVVGGQSTEAGAASVTMSWSVSATKDWAIAAVSIKPASANQAPTAPTTPYSNDTTAQSGQTNPTGLTDPTPAFSAIYNDPDSGDIANKYRVEVNTASDFTGTVMWDSGASGTSMTNTTAGNRSPDIIYAGSALSNSTTYYWRIKFWDDDAAEGTVSATQNFATGTLVTSALRLEGTALQLEGSALQLEGGP